MKEKNGRIFIVIYARRGGGNRICWGNIINSVCESCNKRYCYQSGECDGKSEYQRDNKTYYQHPYFYKDKDDGYI